MELLTGAGHPSKRLKGELGQHYKDTTTGDIWECISSNEHSRIHHQLMGGYIWKKMATGNHIEACNVAANSPSEVVILPETEFKKESGMTTQFEIGTPLSAVPVEGKTYVITVDGVAYESPAIRVEMNGIEMFAIGNASLIGLEGGVADVPYCVMLAPAGVPMDEGTTHTVYGALNFPDGDFRDHATLSIVEKAETASAGGGGFIVHITSKTEMAEPPFPNYVRAWTVELDKTYSEIMAAGKSEHRVECHDSTDSGFMSVLRPCQFSEHGIMFSLYFMGVETALVLQPDGTAVLMTND